MNVAARPVIYGISVCSGVGMLDEGVQAALHYLGIEYRTVCYVERDSYAASALVARMESKALDQALVWDDLKTFPGRAFRGRIHSIAAGFPCQDISIAGRREGLDGSRSGLFFDILDLADDSGAEILFLENVAGIDTATASVIYETEELFERAAARVVGELADRGWHAEWLRLRAAEVGASHERDRWFCFAWRCLADSELPERWAFGIGRTGGVEGRNGRRETHGRSGVSDETLGNSDECGRWPQSNSSIEDRFNSTGCTVANPQSRDERIGQRQQSTPAKGSEPRAEGCGQAMADTARLSGRERAGRKRVQHCDTQLEHAKGERFTQGRPEHDGIARRHSAAEHGCELADAHEQGLEERRRQPRDSGQEIKRTERDSAFIYEGGGGNNGDLFAPGPSDTRWPDILAERPELAPAVGGDPDHRMVKAELARVLRLIVPGRNRRSRRTNGRRVAEWFASKFLKEATQPGVWRVVNGLAYRVDQYRADRLRCVGNGVVALQAAVAYVELIRRSGVKLGKA